MTLGELQFLRYASLVVVGEGRVFLRASNAEGLDPTGAIDPGSLRIGEEADVAALVDLRMAFSVLLSSEATDADLSQVVVYNLSNEVIALLSRGQQVVLTAGYVGPLTSTTRFGSPGPTRSVFDSLGELQAGRITGIETRREGADRLTTLSLGLFAPLGSVSISISGSVEVATLVATLVREGDLAEQWDLASLNMHLPPSLKELNPVYSGLPQQVLAEVLARQGLTYTIENRVIYFHRQGEVDTQRYPARVIREGTGMVGVPTLVPDGIRVRVQLDFDVRLQQPVRVVSELVPEASGDFYVSRIEHRGDTGVSPDWFSELECRPISTGAALNTGAA